ncbi:hypothetical protein HMPREF9088_0745 [Enterococcus italicus DSM 15952]|jgi:predicted Zn-ribbon and HTH transcriptional regulator|uniref:Uncharacterized protein n=1 Tax=Enterococcus italicus (strain DSM 15952 / CCUG 50447 / LMG 22039 / TP 1.5) TaxID=888064 RepID=E6LEF5_ENTI1|nr:hypothetical protein HMPREF9088_0745 [Enterococcus italicus DSM 15952]OJG61118.1 hypothetical protein RT43_GL001164 [Enterococcus italicus DSM 15952]
MTIFSQEDNEFSDGMAVTNYQKIFSFFLDKCRKCGYIYNQSIKKCGEKKSTIFLVFRESRFGEKR